MESAFKRKHRNLYKIAELGGSDILNLDCVQSSFRPIDTGRIGQKMHLTGSVIVVA